MTFAAEMTKAAMTWETEKAAGVSNADVRHYRRVLAAELNSAGANVTGAFATLQSLGVAPIAMDDAVFATDLAAVVAAIAVLVADGASPTQAHVTTANTAYTTLKSDLPPRTYVAADKTSFESALATLVADGASPTQAHVNTANTAWGTFLGGLS